MKLLFIHLDDVQGEQTITIAGFGIDDEPKINVLEC